MRVPALAGGLRYRTAEDLMIRKLKSGQYRLYSRQTDSSGKRRNLGTFRSRPRRRSTSAPFNTSSGRAELV